jgi:hypothetical protein
VAVVAMISPPNEIETPKSFGSGVGVGVSVGVGVPVGVGVFVAGGKVGVMEGSNVARRVLVAVGCPPPPAARAGVHVGRRL